MKYFSLYLINLIVFLGIDAIWLTVVAKKFYAKHLGYLMSDKPNLAAAGIFYLLFVVGLLVLVILPGLKENSLPKTIIYAGLFGLISYATYDLTNLATIKSWPLIVTVVDMIWGTALAISVSAITFLIAKKIGW